MARQSLRGNNAAAKRDIKAFVQRTELTLDQMLRSIALTLLSAIVKRSPVDTGRFRGNWMVQVDLAPQTTETEDKAGSATIAQGQAEIARFKFGETVYLLNHLVYALELEYGSSKQAPSGMVRITAREFQAYVQRAAKGAR